MRASLDKISTNILRFIPFLLAFLTPLFFLPFSSDFFIFNKLYLITLLASISLLAWCIRNLTRGKLSFTISPPLVPLLILVIASIVSSVWLSPITHTSLFGQTTLFIALTVIFITTTASQKNQLTIYSIIYGLIASASLLSLFTILHHYQFFSRYINSDLLSNKYLNLTGGILPALTYTLPIALATLVMVITSKSWLQKSLLFASTLLMFAGSILNISLLFPSDKIPVIAILPLTASWSITVDVFKNWPTALFGTGPETYLSTFTRLRPSYLNFDKNLWNLRFGESGSFLLTEITTIGLIGGLALLFSLLRPITVSLRHHKNHTDPSLSFLVSALIAATVSILFFPAGITSLSLIFSVLIALVVAHKILGTKGTKDISFSLSSSAESQGNYADITSSLHEISATRAFLPWLVTLLSVVLISLYWYFAIPAYRASQLLKEASDIVKTNAVGSFIKQAEAAKMDRFNPNYEAILSQTYQSVAKFYLAKENKTDDDKKNTVDSMQRAVDAARAAALLDPYNVNSYENLANIYTSFIGSADGASDYAVSHLAQAITLDPTNPRLRLQLGILFFNLGDAEQATKLMSQAIELKQDWSVPYFNLAAVYQNKKDYVRALQYMKAGMNLTDPKSSDYEKIQAEIKNLEKLQPANTATSSATTK